MQSTARVVTVAGLALMAAVRPATGQTHDHSDASDHSADRIGNVPIEYLERPVALRPDIGRIHDPVETASADAQRYYDQGLTYLYLYNYIEAARSFGQALRSDPGLALAHRGLSRSYAALGDADAAAAELRRAAELAADAPERERLRVLLREQAVAVQGDSTRRAAYLRDLDEAVARFPSDVELRMLRALNARGAERIERLSEVLAANPDHIGALHELVHTHEHAGEYEVSVRYGRELAARAVGVPHARHMFAHSLMRVGRVPDALAELAAADSIEREHFSRERMPPHLDWHHAHNLELLALTHWFQGQRAQAERLLRERVGVAAARGDFAAHSARADLARLLIGRAEYAAALTELEPLLEQASAAMRPVVRGLTALAYLGLGRTEDAGELLSGEPASEPASPRLTLHLRLGKLELRASREPTALEDSLRALVAEMREDRGPDGWIASLMHLEAAFQALLRGRRFDLAEWVAGQMVEHDPTYGGGHLALGMVRACTGDDGGAERAYGKAAARYADADEDLRLAAEQGLCPAPRRSG